MQSMDPLSIIEELRNFDLAKIEYDTIKSTMLKIGNIAVFQITIPQGSFVLRNRSELISSQTAPFMHPHEISVRNDVYNIKPSRCNWFHTPIFYGVIPIRSEVDITEKASMCALMESSKIIDENDITENRIFDNR
jgi:hypothetical protein